MKGSTRKYVDRKWLLCSTNIYIYVCVFVCVGGCWVCLFVLATASIYLADPFSLCRKLYWNVHAIMQWAISRLAKYRLIIPLRLT